MTVKTKDRDAYRRHCLRMARFIRMIGDEMERRGAQTDTTVRELITEEEAKQFAARAGLTELDARTSHCASYEEWQAMLGRPQ